MEDEFKTGGHILKGMAIDTKAITENLKRGGGTILDGVVRGVDNDRDPDRRAKVQEQREEPVAAKPVKVGFKRIEITEVDNGIYRASNYFLLSDRDGLFGEGITPLVALKELMKAISKANKLRGITK